MKKEHVCPHCGTPIAPTFGKDGKGRYHKFCSIACACWHRVDKSKGEGNCWPWLGEQNAAGYGVIWRGKGKGFLAHRMAYEDFYKVAIGSLRACHKCDNPSCCNPHHIFLGTQRDNMQDMARKGRAHGNDVKGAAHYKTKLTEDDVRAIRSSPKCPKELAVDYEMSIEGIRGIINRYNWRHVA